MPSKHRCFLLTPTDHIVVTLRRYATSKDALPKCNVTKPRYPGAESMTWDIHNIEVEIAREVGTVEAVLDGDYTGLAISYADPRWPAKCDCGFVFRDYDHRQEGRTRLYQRGDNGELVTVSNAPVGALYNARSFSKSEAYNRNGAGMCLVCKTPAGEWLIDGPANNGPGWTRTGTPPDIVVTPSIGIGSPQRMHGWLGGFSGRGDEPGWLCIDFP